MTGTAKTLQRLNSLPASTAILDASGTIVSVNDAWKEFARLNGLRVPHSAIGSNYLQYCRSDEPNGRRFVRNLRALLAGQIDLLTFIYPCHSPTQARWFSLIGLPLSLEKPAGVALVHVNLTDMLPISIGKQQRQGKEQRGSALRSAVHLNAMSDAIVGSVSDSVSSQLKTMVTIRRRDSARRKASEHGKGEQTRLVLNRLTKRQMEVLGLLGEGKTNKEMAKVLLLSPNTIRLHVSAILRRLKLKSRTHAALLASRLNSQRWADSAEGDLNSWEPMHTTA